MSHLIYKTFVCVFCAFIRHMARNFSLTVIHSLSIRHLSHVTFIFVCCVLRWLCSRPTDVSKVTFTFLLLHFIRSLIQVWQSLAQVHTLKMSRTKSFVQVCGGRSVVWRQSALYAHFESVHKSLHRSARRPCLKIPHLIRTFWNSWWRRKVTIEFSLLL